MVDIDNRLYEVLPMDVPSSTNGQWQGKLNHSVSIPGYSTYAVPRSVDGAPASTRPIPPAVPPRNKTMSEMDGSSSLGNSPNDKGGLLPLRSRSTSGNIGKAAAMTGTCVGGTKKFLRVAFYGFLILTILKLLLST